MFEKKENTPTQAPRTLGYAVARELSMTEIEMVSGGGANGCQSQDSSWCTGCDGRCTQADC